MKKGSRGEGLFDFIGWRRKRRSVHPLVYFISFIYNRGGVPIIEDDGGVGKWRYAYCSTLWR